MPADGSGQRQDASELPLTKVPHRFVAFLVDEPGAPEVAVVVAVGDEGGERCLIGDWGVAAGDGARIRRGVDERSGTTQKPSRSAGNIVLLNVPT